MYKITPLQWVHHPDLKLYRANTIFGDFRIDMKNMKLDYCFQEYYEEDTISIKTLAQGKRLAEKMYLVKLLPALEKVNG